MSLKVATYFPKSDGTSNWVRHGRSDVPTSGVANPAQFATPFVDEQFSNLSSSRWLAYDASNGNQNFGNSQRVGVWSAANVATGAGASAGATNGTSLRLYSHETDAGSGTLPTAGALPGSAGTRYSYTGGMLDSKSVNYFFPLYCCIEVREKICHGQGLWPSGPWLTAKNGGASLVEIDLIEYFHAEVPGKNSTTIHRVPASGAALVTSAYTNNGSAANQNWGRTFFEAPTLTPAWHKWRFDLMPVTDASGTVTSTPGQPSQYVRLRCFLDDVYQGMLIDSSALWWSSQCGGWNMYLQGSQIDGKNAGHPRSTLGYSHQLDSCLISGTPPNSCATSLGGYNILAPNFTDPASTLEIDYLRVWEYTG